MASLVNGEVRVFPYVGETYLGVEPTGYSNKKSAYKYMDKKGVLPEDFVFAHFGGKYTYCRQHLRLYRHSGWKSSTEISDEAFEKIYALYVKYDEERNGNHNDVLMTQYEMEGKAMGYNIALVYVDLNEYYKYEQKYISEHVEYRKGIVHFSIEYTGEVE